MKTLSKTKLSCLLTAALFMCGNLVAQTQNNGFLIFSNEISRLIWFIITIICSVILAVILFYKIKRTLEKPDPEVNPDVEFSLDYEELKQHVKKTFFKMQDARMSRNIDVAKGIVTESLYSDYKEQLEKLKNDNKINVLNQIEINEIRIIGCEDYMEGYHRRFIAQIHGKMIDYTIDELTGDVIENSSMNADSFTDTYHFIRDNKDWRLDYVDNFVTMFDVIQSKEYLNEEKYENTLSSIPFYP